MQTVFLHEMSKPNFLENRKKKKKKNRNVVCCILFQDAKPKMSVEKGFILRENQAIHMH